MIYSVFTFGMILWLLWWALVISFCVSLYRSVRLPTLPWIALYYAVGILAVPLMQFYGHRIAASGHVPALGSTSLFHSSIALSASVATVLDYSGNLLVLFLAFSEAAVLVRRLHPEARSRLLQALSALHSHHRALGVLAIVLTALLPAPAMIYFYTHP